MRKCGIFRLRYAENAHLIFRKLPLDNFPHSAIRIPQNTRALCGKLSTAGNLGPWHRVLLADSLLGADWPGSEKARYRLVCLITFQGESSHSSYFLQLQCFTLHAFYLFVMFIYWRYFEEYLKWQLGIGTALTQLNSTQRASMDAGVKTPQCPHGPHLSSHYCISIL